jgi:hypothetical protein
VINRAQAWRWPLKKSAQSSGSIERPGFPFGLEDDRFFPSSEIIFPEVLFGER